MDGFNKRQSTTEDKILFTSGEANYMEKTKIGKKTQGIELEYLTHI